MTIATNADAGDFSDREKVALEKVIAAALVKQAKADIPQGTEESVNFMVRVSGTIKKGTDSTQKS